MRAGGLKWGIPRKEISYARVKPVHIGVVLLLGLVAVAARPNDHGQGRASQGPQRGSEEDIYANRRL